MPAEKLFGNGQLSGGDDFLGLPSLGRRPPQLRGLRQELQQLFSTNPQAAPPIALAMTLVAAQAARQRAYCVAAMPIMGAISPVGSYKLTGSLWA